jgi:ribonuclease Z
MGELLKLTKDDKILLTFVGTGSAKTNLNRFHTSFILSNSNDEILVDCGDGISRKLIELKLNPNKIKNILITHFHPDHFSGIAALLVNMKLYNRKTPLNIFIHQDMFDFIKYFFTQSYLFFERFNFQVTLLHTIMKSLFL